MKPDITALRVLVMTHFVLRIVCRFKGGHVWGFYDADLWATWIVCDRCGKVERRPNCVKVEAKR